ncbi:hypothetical protein HER10_EVM0012538 [Colletotrichum scovillei]|uniref:Azaphilone pigments biosynthesis cluster protein L N-terminal domain-containing protein n=1 Tax=Colletotrichum scovillei TaxID=1209932 RepID=A0A9P7UH61_9PEZI|nr:uncharacterized protein HER10_EVM0012538 [Colletotrichum scovillei]KAF4786012.1 hypothetical protein HER10_EVM0012538 [Colletotrichum scovillei]KAG7055601.1 hypothetical protein JMJ77_0008056 [Colletotrichum scovillei]KAG7075077.1 hypothetical protein JMJ76_0011540 [Colletotrichum scovillei]KAG7082111.1 hypothetical protein JMJ78_0004216 [Colletotrichum scovillei]
MSATRPAQADTVLGWQRFPSMADPLSITTSVLALLTTAAQSVKLLVETVSRYKGRDRTLSRLQAELEDFLRILDALHKVVETESAMMVLLKDPIRRCSQLCNDFEKALRVFSGKSKVGFRDWAKMEFMRGDINDFLDALSGYKETISIGLGTITMQTSQASQEVLEEYNEMIMDTMYRLNVRLQRIDEKMDGLTRGIAGNMDASGTTTDLEDERVVTERCLRICEDAQHYLETLASDGDLLKQQLPRTNGGSDQMRFEAQLMIRRTLDENRDNFSETIGRLQERLASLPQNGTSQDESEKSRLEEDLKASKKCLEVCKAASETVAQQRIYRVGELIADVESDQVVITTLADLFDVKKATSTNGSAQWIGSFTDETARQISTDRYRSRFGALSSTEMGTTTQGPRDSWTAKDHTARRANTERQSSAREATGRRPTPNEVRRRASGVDGKLPANDEV